MTKFNFKYQCCLNQKPMSAGKLPERPQSLQESKCPRGFSSSGDLIRHVKSAHSNWCLEQIRSSKSTTDPRMTSAMIRIKAGSEFNEIDKNFQPKTRQKEEFTFRFNSKETNYRSYTQTYGV